MLFLMSQNYSAKVELFQSDSQLEGVKKIIKMDNSIWVGTKRGIYQTVPEYNRLITVCAFYNSNSKEFGAPVSVLSMFLDEEKNLWVGTEQNGILKYNGKTDNFVLYNYNPKNKTGLTSNRINCFYEDAFGVMWIGTAQGGINKLDKNQKPFYNYVYNPYDSQSLSSNLITDIAEDSQGRVWLSFYDNTICRTNGKIMLSEGNRIHFERLDKEFGQLKNKIVVSLFHDSKGYLWIGTYDGIYLFDKSTSNLKRVRLAYGKNNITTALNQVIRQLRPDQILIGGTQVYLLNNPWELILENEPVQVEDVLFDIGKNNLVNDFALDEYGNYWFATIDGIFRVGREKEKIVVKNHLTANTGNDSLHLCHNNIFSLHKGKNNDIWAGTFGGGLMKIQLNSTGDPEQIKSYHKKDGLPDEAVYGILEDDKGKFWISTDMGICRFDPLTEKIDVYDINDGTGSINFRKSAYLKTRSGIMLMGGLNGLTVFDPSQIKKNTIPPKV
ncbi:MAG TPA: hypothetical protein ENL09_01055, partial [Bacteroidetes bacterium]|nr:hypothetical protein [Bacteroidota bacterium]